MARVKRSVNARKKRRATLDRAKGFRGQRKSSYADNRTQKREAPNPVEYALR